MIVIWHSLSYYFVFSTVNSRMNQKVFKNFQVYVFFVKTKKKKLFKDVKIKAEK